MPGWFWVGIVFMVAMDVVVLTWIFRRKMRESGLDLGQLREVSKRVNERAGDYLRANWSGNTDELPTALRGLMPIVAGVARDQGKALDDRTLELLVKASLAGQRLATRAELDRAFDRLRDEAQPAVA
jgi:hypothetical protein